MRKVLLALVLTMLCLPFASTAFANEFENLPEITLPNSAPLADGSYPWISGTHFFWEWAMNYVLEHNGLKEPLSRERMIELGRLDANGNKRGVPVGGTQIFWAMNMETRQPVQVPAVLRKIGKHCYIYVEEGATNMPDEVVNKLCQQFDDVIYPTNTTYFGFEWKPGIDWDNRINLLFLDIKDGWAPGKGYVGGYYFPLNEYSSRIFAYSNEREMVYLDINPSDPSSEDYLGILAHEYQHLIHRWRDERETRWLNEACAQLAFFVNGYGHAPQSFQFVKNSDTGMEEFDNGIDDYGCVYAFFYYLHENVAGATIEEKKAFFRDLCDNQNKSLQSIRETMAAHGFDKPLEEVFIDWCIANTANNFNPENPLHEYDETISLNVNPAARYAFDALPTEAVKTDVQPWAADYISVVPEVRWEPHCPTMVDTIALIGEGPGKVHWTINGGQLPPEALIPDGSVIEGDKVVSQLVQREDGKWTVDVGRFVKLGVMVNHLDVEFVYENATSKVYTVPVYSIETLTGKRFARTNGSKGFKFVFDGKKGKPFVLYSIMKTETGCQVTPIELNDKNEATVEFAELPADLIELTFMVAALDGKKFKYEYTIEGLGAADELAQAARLRQLQHTVDNKDYDKVARAADLAEANLARSVAGNSGALARLTARFSNAPAKEKRYLHPILKRVLRKARYRVLDKASGGNGDLFRAAEAIASAKAEDQDDSHDNLGYFTFKKMELIHALTHLKIDPQFVEGQLIEIWTTLQISQGLPNLPIPDGLNIVDFKDDQALNILKQWAQDFELDYPFPDGGKVEGPRPVVQSDDLAKVKRVIQRLILAEAVVEYCYNSSLMMADDMSMCIFDFVRLILGAKTAIDDIAGNFTELPIVGPVFKKLVAKLHGKLVKLIQGVATLLAAKLPAPYNSAAPTVVSLIGWGYAKFMKLDLPSDSAPWYMEMGAKLLGKYALTALPKVGYVSRGQLAVDIGAERASVLKDEGTLIDAKVRVWDDGNEATANSVREIVAAEITDRHNTAVRNRQLADIGKKIMVISQYGALIDPTVITKVLAVISGVASTGVLAHAGWRTGSYFFQLPRTMAVKGVEGAYGPVPEVTDPEGAERKIDVAPLAVHQIQELTRALERSSRKYDALIEEAHKAALKRDRRQEFANKMDEIMAEDDLFDEIAVKLEAVLLSDETTVRDDNACLDIYGRSQACHLERVAALADLAASFQQGTTVQSCKLEKTRDYVNHIIGRVRGVLKGKSARPVLLVSKVLAETKGNVTTVKATVSNLSATPVKEVTARLLSGLQLQVDGGNEQDLGLLAPGSDTEITFMFKDPQNESVELKMIGVELQAAGCKPLAGFTNF